MSRYRTFSYELKERLASCRRGNLRHKINDLSSFLTANSLPWSKWVTGTNTKNHQNFSSFILSFTLSSWQQTPRVHSSWAFLPDSRLSRSHQVPPRLTLTSILPCLIICKRPFSIPLVFSELSPKLMSHHSGCVQCNKHRPWACVLAMMSLLQDMRSCCEAGLQARDCTSVYCTSAN